jgi:hypothetical protein
MRKLSVGVLVLSVLVVFGFSSSANAVLIRVSMESSLGAGDFDANVYGFIDSFSTPLSTAAFYQYGSPNAASYNGELNGGPLPVSSKTQLFFVDAADGLSFVVVHDNPNDGSGGSTRTQWNLFGDTAGQVLADDTGEPVAISGGGTQFDSTKNWAPCCTDGYAIGYLDGNWSLIGGFLWEPTGINSWAAVSGNSPDVELFFGPNRVRFDLASVPEPATMLLIGTGLIGLAGLRRRFKK